MKDLQVYPYLWQTYTNYLASYYVAKPEVGINF